jgi:hypothetical protein|tara:strand:- start:198 stop:413 length:216 start_codon:yes stop_codon:yes gene_type:complete
MLKNINIILGIIVTVGIVYTFQTLSNSNSVAEQEASTQLFEIPRPGSAGDEWEEFNNLLGPQGISTDQECE